MPSGAGLSSSAAVECATVLAVSALSGIRARPAGDRPPRPAAENDFVGVPCGPMDQTASAACRQGAVLLFDTRAGTVENIPFDPAAHGLAVLVIDTRVAHSLADGEYGKRRASCERAAHDPGRASVARHADRRPARRAGPARPTTNCAVGSGTWSPRTTGWQAPSSCCGTDQVADIGDLLTASHASLRDDYDVSCPELDLAVDYRAGGRRARRPDDRRRIRRISHRAGPD